VAVIASAEQRIGMCNLRTLRYIGGLRQKYTSSPPESTYHQLGTRISNQRIVVSEILAVE